MSLAMHLAQSQRVRKAEQAAEQAKDRHEKYKGEGKNNNVA